MKTHQTIKKKCHNYACEHCDLKRFCFPPVLPESEEKKHLDQVVDQCVLVKKGELVCQADEPFSGLLVARSGALKALQVDAKGRELISDFYLPGTLFGLDALGCEQYVSTVVALEDSSVCRLSFDALLTLTQNVPALQKYLMVLIGGRLKEASEPSLLHYDAKDRLLLFLKRISKHFEQRGFSGSTFNLPMPRKDIANYLELANETVSRLFQSLQEQGIIEVKRKTIRWLS